MQYILGIDVGTQGIKTSVYNESGLCVGSAFNECRVRIEKGKIFQDPEELFGLVIKSIKNSADCQILKNVAAVGIDAQMAGIMGINKNYEPVTYYDSWLDLSSAKYISLMKSQCEEMFIKTSGGPVGNAHAARILKWKSEYSETYERIYKFVTLSAYIAGRMAGIGGDQAFIDTTQVHFSGFANVNTLKWEQELINDFSLDSGKFPRIARPYEIIGGLAKGIADICGLKQGVPVIAGCGDQAATSLGAGITKKGQAFDSAGTASVFSVATDIFAPDMKNKTVLYARSIIDDLWIPLSYIGGGGMCISWFVREFCQGKTEKEMDLEAERISAGCDGVVFIPHMSGRVCPSAPEAKGCFMGLGWNHTRAHMYRAVLESIGYEYGIYKNCMPEEIISNVTVVGGGAKSLIFSQIKSDILGLEYLLTDHSESAVMGSAITAGYAVKLFGDIKKTAAGLVRVKNQICPGKANKESYQQYSKSYERTVKMVSDFCGGTI